MNFPLRRMLAVASLGLFFAGASPASAAPQAEWRIEVKEDKHGDPHSKVDLVINGDQVVRLVSGKEINQYAAVPRAKYAEYEIPAKALCACASRWAGSGTAYYVVPGGEGKLDLFRRDMDEEAADDGFKKVRTIRIKEP